MEAYIVLPEFSKYIIAIGDRFGITWYGTMYALGFLSAYFLFVYWSRNKKISLTYDDIYYLVLFGILGVILGGRLGYVVFYNLPYYLSNPEKIIAVWEGGMSFHGGLIGVIIFMWIFARMKRIYVFDVVDLVAVVVPIGLGFGRIGNFINQELFGRPAEGIPWAMVFQTDPLKIPRHPSQLYEAILEGLLLFLIMLAIKDKKLPVGVKSAVFGIGYSIFRIIVEFFREPDPQIGYILGFITMGQILSFILLFASIIVFVLAFRFNISSKVFVYGRQRPDKSSY